MKRIAYFLAATLLVAAASCSKEVNPVVDNDQPIVEDNQPVSTVKKISFTAYADNGDETRTSLNADNSVTWAAGEAIYVFDGKAPRKFVSTNTEPAKVVTFEGEADTEATTYYAVSPAATKSGSTITATIPVFQTATAGTFDPKAAISVAVSGTDPNDPTALKFKNAAAAVKFQIRNNDVTKIRLEAINGEKLAGKATITLDSDNIPQIQMVGAESESCVILTGAFVANTDYVIAVAPGTYSGGFRLTLFNADGKYASIANTNSQTLGRSDLMNFGTMPAVTTWKEGTMSSFFTETFALTNGNGGRDGVYTGEIGKSTIVYDKQYFWGNPERCGGAKQCLKFGTSGDDGSFFVEGLSISGTAVLSFSAAGWGSGTNHLHVDIEGATASGDTDITLSNGAWNNYSVNIINASGNVTISFYGRRGFLDDIQLSVYQEGGPVDPNYDAPSLEINNVTPQNKQVGPNNGRALFDVEANVPWTISADQSFVALTVSDNHVEIDFDDMTEGTSRDVSIKVVPAEGEEQSITFTQVATTVEKGATWSFPFSTSTNNANSLNMILANSTSTGSYNHLNNASHSLNNLVWSFTSAGNGSVVYIGGQQLGAGDKNNIKRDVTSLALSTSSYTDGIETVSVQTRSNGNTTLEVILNGVSLGSQVIDNDMKTYTFTSPSIVHGESIVLHWSNTLAGKNILIGSIQIN